MIEIFKSLDTHVSPRKKILFSESLNGGITLSYLITPQLIYLDMRTYIRSSNCLGLCKPIVGRFYGTINHVNLFNKNDLIKASSIYDREKIEITIIYLFD